MNRATRSATALTSLTILLAALAGCVDQKKDIAVYQKELDKLPGMNLPVPNDTQPLTLQEAIRLSLNDNLTLGQSGETYLQDLIAKDKAFSAFLPNISMGPVLSENQPLGSLLRPIHNFNVPLSASQTVVNVPEQVAIDVAAARAEQDRQNLLDAQQTALLDVVTAYYSVLFDERSVTVDENSLAEQEEKVRQAKAQYQLGNGTPLNIAQNQSLASQTRVLLIAARTSVTTDRAALATLLGSPAASRPLTDDFDPPLNSNRPLQKWIEEAKATRQDLKAAAAAVKVDRLAIQAAIAEYYPTVNLDLGYLIYDENMDMEQRLTSALSANIPIFTGGSIEADVRNAFSQFRKDVLAERAADRRVEQDIRTAYASLHDSIDEVRELRIELAADRDALKYSQAEYSVGLAINLDVLTAFDALLSTELNLAKQEYAEKTNYLTLLRDAGRLNLLDAAPSTGPSTQPDNSMEEITTPEVIYSTTQPVYPAAP